MRDRLRLLRPVAIMVFLLAAAVTAAPLTVFAATADDLHAGDVLWSVPVDYTISCPTVAPSLALVQSSKLSVITQVPLLLVTTCFSTKVSQRSILYFLDPNTGKIVTTLQTIKSGKAYAPGNGWASLVLAPDKGLLFGCGDNGELYTIDYSVFNSTPDGTLTSVPKPPTSSCTGLAWDPSNKTLYLSTSTTVYHFDTLGNPQSPASLPAPAACSISGLSVVGGVLQVACNGSVGIQRVDKISGAALPDHATVAFKGGALADLECDPVTFAGANVDVVWSKIVTANLIQAFRVPGGTCGLPATAKVFAPAACPDPTAATDPYRQDVTVGTVVVPAVPKDTDGDGLWDCWEDGTRWNDGLPGIDFDGNLKRDFVLCIGTNCADPKVKDIFVEIDYMGGDSSHPQGHLPDPTALANVQAAFLNSPVDAPNGIRVHFEVDDQLTHAATISLVPCSAAGGAVDFDQLKRMYFGTSTERTSGNPNTLFAKQYAFRYMVFAHNLYNSGASGCSEVPGDDSVITLADFGPTDSTNPYYQRGTTDQQAGTVMHELGHNLGLRHGGGDNINCKPNYLSVMNYSRQLPDFLVNRRLDYSRGALSTLDESALSEALGIGTLTSYPFLDGDRTVYSVTNTISMQVEPLGTLCDPVNGTCVDYGTFIDWNHNGTTPDSTPVAADVNKYLAAGCDGTGSVLTGFDDWGNLQYNARASLDFSAGVTTANSVEHQDKSGAQELASFNAADSDHDGTPDAFGCGSSTIPCAIDVKPGTNPAVLSKGNEANVQVAILSSATFDAPDQVLRETLRLNDVGVKLNNQGKGTCSAVSITPGRLDLLCQFSANALPLGGNYAILEGLAYVHADCLTPGVCATTGIRARDFVIVVK